MAEPGIFYDPSRRRWRRVTRIASVLATLAAALLGLFLASLLLIPRLPPVPGVTEPLRHALRRPFSPLPRRAQRLRSFLLQRTRRDLLRETRSEPAPSRRPPDGRRPLLAAFYATWQEEGLHSLRANAGKITHLMPQWLHLASDGASLDLRDWDPEATPHNKDVLRIISLNRLSVLPVLDNSVGGRFQPQLAHRLLSSPERQKALSLRLRDWLKQGRFSGINVDFEELAGEDYARLPEFLERLRAALAPEGLLVSADLEAERAELDWARAAQPCDFIVLMAYDEHFAGGRAGPIASFAWYQKALARALRDIPGEKLVIGLGNYAYDWPEGRPPAEPLSFQQALLAARDNDPDSPPERLVNFDPKALNPTFNYEDERRREHEVWMLDAVTAGNQWRLAQQKGARGAALWILGSEDPSLWTLLDPELMRRPPDLSQLEEIRYPYDVEYSGTGEVLTVASTPAPGRRRLELDRATGFALDEAFSQLPATFVLRRSGYQPRLVALTFDDGPSELYTGKILDVLKEFGVPGTFFVIGENAERYPDLIERLWHEGHEIGNHTFTHPNMAAVSESRARLELTATQRALQSILGRSTILFRPPFNADAEPASAEEVRPITLASKMGYLTIGEFIDPRDWSVSETLPDGTRRKHDAYDVAAHVLSQVRAGKGSTVLLHDGGGDRANTVAALRLIIPALRGEGYRFVGVSGLIGLSREAAMPAGAEKDNALLGVDRVVFEIGYWVSFTLRLIFLSAIALASARMALLLGLAEAGRRRDRRLRFDPAFRPSASVLIAAYNEEAVIRRTLAAVLASPQAQEIVVVDDGSTDGTAEAVEKAFPGERRLRLLRQKNKGKAAALNAALAASAGEYVLCLDADTHLAPDAVSKLLRRFADPCVGAVAGNVKVGNRVNPLTRLQTIEYVTNQNLERRAYAVLNAVTVVPGAAGAWRRTALERAGGFRSDTLAEDMDLTWRLRRAGWRIEAEMEAVALTEAPQTLGALFRQRFRWVFGTLQCLWKHRDALGRYGWFGRLVLPSLWLFQIVYQCLSPLIDLQVAWLALAFLQTVVTSGFLRSDWQPLPQAAATLYNVGLLYAFFFLLELGASWIAFWMDGERKRLLAWVFAQRFLYRQLMYAVVLKSVSIALQGRHARWGKLERLGTVAAP